MWATRPQISIEDLKSIQAQTLLIQGENDFITKAHFLEMVEHIPHTTQRIIPKVGHNLLHKASNSVTKAVIDFIR
jgi:pimeloyl-ACP methyl ester carboxylesterase